MGQQLGFLKEGKQLLLGGAGTRFEGVALCAVFLTTQRLVAENSMDGILPTGSKNFLSRGSVVLLVDGEEVDLDTFSVVCLSQKEQVEPAHNLCQCMAFVRQF